MVNNWVQVQENAAVLLLFTDGGTEDESLVHLTLKFGVETSLRWGDSCTSVQMVQKHCGGTEDGPRSLVT
jgi:hypothetical protein